MFRVQLVQGGIVQEELTVALDRARSRRVSVGSARSATLRVEGSTLPPNQWMFQISKGAVKVVLDPRLDGFVTSGSVYAAVSQWICPRGAIAPLASPLSPLVLDLKKGARGVLELAGFQVLFSWTQERKAAKSRTIPGAPKGAFALAPADDPVERWTLPVALVATLSVALPCLWLLGSAAPPRPTGFLALAPRDLLGLIHPSHFRFLPRVYGDGLRPEAMFPQAIAWVQALQLRWRGDEEAGQEFAILDSKPVVVDPQVPRQVGLLWSAHQAWEEGREQRATRSRLARTLGAHPVLGTLGAPGRNARYRRGLVRMERLYRALALRVAEEQRALETPVRAAGFAPREGFLPPAAKDILTQAQVSSEFEEVHARYAAGERFAAEAARQSVTSPWQRARGDAPGQESPPVAFGREDLLPIAGAGEEGASEVWDALLRNAKVTSGQVPLREIPVAHATIDQRAVRRIVQAHQRELGSCFDEALLRNPNLSGEVVLKWGVGPAGQVVWSKVLSSHFQDDRLTGCFQTRLKSWTFPHPSHGIAAAEYSFRLVAGDPQTGSGPAAEEDP